jgi:hypothetical protein
MPVRADPTNLSPMTTASFHLATLLALTLVAGLLMASAGLSKKKLSWKAPPRRCPTCGRARRYDCPCRR